MPPRKKTEKPTDDEFAKILAEIEAETTPGTVEVEIVPDEEPEAVVIAEPEPVVPVAPIITGDDSEAVMRAAMAQLQGEQPEEPKVDPEPPPPPEPALRVRALPQTPKEPKAPEPAPPEILSARISAQTLLEIEAGRARVEARKKGMIA